LAAPVSSKRKSVTNLWGLVKARFSAQQRAWTRKGAGGFGAAILGDDAVLGRATSARGLG
jgi:hypothetical protein